MNKNRVTTKLSSGHGTRRNQPLTVHQKESVQMTPDKLQSNLGIVLTLLLESPGALRVLI
jgi:hypothetical protein